MHGRSKERPLLNPDYKDILSVFNEERVEYLVIGAYALAVHGVPRATGDLDLWLCATEENARCAWRALGKFGASLQELQAADLMRPGTVFQIGVAPRRVDILTSIDGVEFDDAWQSKLQLEVDGISIQVISRLHLIANKKAVGRPQDLVDIASLEKQKA